MLSSNLAPILHYPDLRGTRQMFVGFPGAAKCEPSAKKTTPSPISILLIRHIIMAMVMSMTDNSRHGNVKVYHTQNIPTVGKPPIEIEHLIYLSS